MDFKNMFKDQIHETSQLMKARVHYREIQSCAAMKCLTFVVNRVNNNEPSLPEEVVTGLYKIGLARMFINGTYTRFDVNTHQPIATNVRIDFDLLKLIGYNFNEEKALKYIDDEKRAMNS
jgi:hypothetical protein